MVLFLIKRGLLPGYHFLYQNGLVKRERRVSSLLIRGPPSPPG